MSHACPDCGTKFTRVYNVYRHQRKSCKGKNEEQPNTIPNGSIPNGSIPNGSIPNGSIPNGSNFFAQKTANFFGHGNEFFQEQAAQAANFFAKHSTQAQPKHGGKSSTINININQETPPGQEPDMLDVNDALVIKDLVEKHLAQHGVVGMGTMLEQHFRRRCRNTPGTTIDMEQINN